MKAHRDLEPIHEWISRIGIKKFTIHFVLAPAWDFLIERASDTLKALIFLLQAVGL